jgi:hypothetical protein
LIGTSANDSVAANGVVALSDGNYAVVSPYWNNGATLIVAHGFFGTITYTLTGADANGNRVSGDCAECDSNTRRCRSSAALPGDTPGVPLLGVLHPL